MSVAHVNEHQPRQLPTSVLIKLNPPSSRSEMTWTLCVWEAINVCCLLDLSGAFDKVYHLFMFKVMTIYPPFSSNFLWLYLVSQFHLCFLADLTIMTEHITLYTLLVSVALIGYNQVGCSPPNILFLASDDMRPEIGAYLGSDFPSPVHPDIHTP